MLTAGRNKIIAPSAIWNESIKNPVTEDNETNAIIKAYLKGLNVGKIQGKKELEEKFAKDYLGNIAKAKRMAEELFSFINHKRQFNCTNVFLRINGISHFDLLFLIKPDDYTSNEFNSVYKKVFSKRKRLNSDHFHLSILFMPEVNTLDRSKISRDGYRHKYGQEK